MKLITIQKNIEAQYNFLYQKMIEKNTDEEINLRKVRSELLRLQEVVNKLGENKPELLKHEANFEEETYQETCLVEPIVVKFTEIIQDLDQEYVIFDAGIILHARKQTLDLLKKQKLINS